MQERKIIVVFDQCIISRPQFLLLREYCEQGRIFLRGAEKVRIESGNWQGPNAEEIKRLSDEHDVIGNLAAFDDGGMKFPFSFFEPEELQKMESIIFRDRDTHKMKEKNFTNLKRDVRNAFSAYRFKADFFVTRDNHILKKRNEIEKEFGLRILTDDEMLDYISHSQC
jgi:hypothetical protein